MHALIFCIGVDDMVIVVLLSLCNIFGVNGPLLQLNLYLFKSPDKSHASDTYRPKKKKPM